MSTDPRVAEIRAFHRTVTERIGALEEHYLASGRSLGLDRLIGGEGAEVRELREHLGLDSGYLSRLLAEIETAAVKAGAGQSGLKRIGRWPRRSALPQHRLRGDPRVQRPTLCAPLV